jgi:glycosyltransferase involved in cell wall biosynthesis
VTYSIVTPAHNEAENLERLCRSLETQTVRPTRWVIVENGSTDSTLELASELAARRPWVEARSVAGSASPDRGASVVSAIHDGVAALGTEPDVIVVVDADVSFPETYFECLLSRFESDDRLGMASGTCFEQENGSWRERHVTGEHVWGAARAYRQDVIPIVMPLEGRMGWDGIDQIKANVAGWRTATFKDLPFYHHRPEGSRDGTSLKARVNQGRASYYMGYRLSYLLLRSLFAMRHGPSAVGLVWGYSLDAVSRRPRCTDPAVRGYVREQQSVAMWKRRLREARGRR